MKIAIELKDSLYDLTIVSPDGVTLARDRGDLEPMLDVVSGFIFEYGRKFPEKTFWYFGETSKSGCEDENIQTVSGDTLNW